MTVGSAPTNPLGPPHPYFLTNVDVALRVVPVVLLPLRTTLLILSERYRVSVINQYLDLDNNIINFTSYFAR